jgi:prevent-host-death family protein
MYTIRQAQTNLSKLLRKAARGEEVIIARGKTPVAKLVAVPTQKNKRVLSKQRSAAPHPHPSLKIG